MIGRRPCCVARYHVMSKAKGTGAQVHGARREHVGAWEVQSPDVQPRRAVGEWPERQSPVLPSSIRAGIPGFAYSNAEKKESQKHKTQNTPPKQHKNTKKTEKKRRNYTSRVRKKHEPTGVLSAGARENKTGARDNNRRDPPAWGVSAGARETKTGARDAHHQTEGSSLRSTGETRREPGGGGNGYLLRQLT